jgi:hypothetical protein
VSSPDLASSVWAPWAEIAVDLGTVSSWEASGGEWGSAGQAGGAVWGVGEWGSGYTTPSSWLVVTAAIESLDIDTGRNGIDDPGEVGTCSLVLFDPAGEYAIGGARSALGRLVRVRVRHMASDRSRLVFYGKVTEANAVGSFSEPTTSVKAIDMLGSVLGSDDGTPLPAQSTAERLTELLDRASFPGELRDLDDDMTELAPVDKVGSRLDAARGAAASAVGGSLWAAGDGTIRYRHGTFSLDPSQLDPTYHIGTAPGFVCPSVLDLIENVAGVLNVYDWANQAGDVHATATHSESVRRYGRNASMRTDLLNVRQTEAVELVAGELKRTANPLEQIDNCEVPIHDDESAELVLVAIGELAEVSYTGAAPWGGFYLVGGYSHHISPDEWTVHVKAYEATIGGTWGRAVWGVAEWAA